MTFRVIEGGKKNPEEREFIPSFLYEIETEKHALAYIKNLISTSGLGIFEMSDEEKRNKAIQGKEIVGQVFERLLKCAVDIK